MNKMIHFFLKINIVNYNLDIRKVDLNEKGNEFKGFRF